MALVDLPPEIFEQVLSCRIISARDICRVGKCSTRLKSFSRSGSLWRVKLQQHCSWLFCGDKVSYISASAKDPDHDWLSDYRSWYSSSFEVRQCLRELAAKYQHSHELLDDAFGGFSKMLHQHPHAFEFVLAELKSLVFSKTSQNLTLEYYARKALRFMQHFMLQPTIECYVSLPAEEQQPLEGAIYVAKWLQPTCNVTKSDVQKEISHISDIVHSLLEERYPDHASLHLVISEPTGNSTTLEGVPAEQVLQCINNVLFHALKFSSMYSGLPGLSLIDKVLKNRAGLPMIMAVLYHTLASRFAVHLDFVTAQIHLGLLRYTRSSFHSNPKYKYGYVNVLKDGELMTGDEVLNQFFHMTGHSEIPLHASYLQFKELVRMCRNYIFDQPSHLFSISDVLNVQELYKLTSPGDHVGIDYYSLGIKGPKELGNVEDKKVANEYPHVAYSVGMIMQHRKYDYLCVIYGWDDTCKASETWKHQMSVYNLRHKDRQPFYEVLAHDQSMRYASQENLQPAPQPVEIGHSEVGRYFDKFCHMYYHLNEQTLARYPEDQKKTEKLAEESYGA